MFEALGNPVVMLDLYQLETKSSSNLEFTDLRHNLTLFEYDEDIEKVGQLRLVFENPNDVFSDDERLQGRGKLLRVRWGYLTALSPVKTCVIRFIAPGYGDDGRYTLTITAWDAVSRAFMGSHPRNWGRRNTSDIASEIAYKWGLVPIIPEPSEDSREQPYIQPGKMKDLAYLKFLARRRGWECHSDGINLYYGPDRFDEDPIFVAVYGAHVFPTKFNSAPIIMTSFAPDIDQGKRPDVRQTSVDPRKKTVATHKSNESDVSQDDPSRQSLGAQAIYSFRDQSTELRGIQDEEREAGAGSVQPSAETNQAQVEKDTKAEQWRVKRKSASASAQFRPGNVELRVRRIINVQGVSSTHAGKWKISQARHKIQVADSVYAVSCTLKRSSKGDGSTEGDQKSTNENKKQAADGTDQEAKVQVARVDFRTGNTSLEYLNQ